MISYTILLNLPNAETKFMALLKNVATNQSIISVRKQIKSITKH